MGTFALRARMLNGTYTGHLADESRDDFPDPARVYSALVQAAYTGSTAELVGDRLMPAEASLNALKWLEKNPPDGLQIPATAPLASMPPTAYRKEGLLKVEGKTTKNKISPKATSDGVAVNGTFGYTWTHEVPPEVRSALDALCGDVSHLGEALSPAILETEDVNVDPQSTHSQWVRDERVGSFTPGGRRVRVPLPGRFDELESAHQEMHPTRCPSLAKDKHKTTEESIRVQVPRSRLTSLRYVHPRRLKPSVPWSHAIAIAVDGISAHPDQADPIKGGDGHCGIPPEQRVAWCVTLHRALAKRIRGAAPPLITGNYGTATPPPNRLAVQYIEPGVLAASEHEHVGGPGGAFLLMVPRDAASDDLLSLEQALIGLSDLWSRHGVARLHIRDDTIPCESFWQSPAEGMARCWATSPAMMSDVRPQGRKWTLRDSALAAVGFVWRRDEGLEAAESESTNKYRRLVDQVQKALGTKVVRTRRLVGDGARYAHRLPVGVAAEPFTAVLRLGEQMPDRALVAVGQTRHLGGGLLVPVDAPASVMELVLGGAHDE